MQPVTSRIEALFFDKRSSSNLQLDALDGLRGIAVLFVVLSHLGGQGAHVALNFAGSGKYGVYLFFVLSAFLLTLPLLDSEPREFGDVRRWLRYALRRVLRIFPLYVTVLLATWVIWLRFRSPYFIPMNTQELIQHLSLRAGKLIYWTIPVEFKYYVVLPFVAFVLVVVLRRRPCWLVPSTLLAILAIAAWLAPGVGSLLDPVALLPYLPAFLWGSLAACLHRSLSRRGGVSSSGRLALDLLAVACLGAVLAMVPQAWGLISGGEVERAVFHGRIALFGALWSTLLLATLHGTGAMRRILETRPLRLVGVVSFSMYLTHLPVVWFTTHWLRLEGLAGVVVGLIGATTVACLSYLAIERPFIRSPWALSLTSSRVPSAAAPATPGGGATP